MLDISLYRQNEILAKNEMPKWHIRARHSVDVFEKAGFPVRVDNVSQLRALLDTMSETGFALFHDIMRGFDDAELEQFLDGAEKSVRFSLQMFPDKKPIFAANNLMQAFLFYTLINKIGKFDSVLELGPGSGYLAFFMSQMNNSFYVQAEACESFYLLQSHINYFLFGDKFYESAIFSNSKTADFWTVSGLDSFELPVELEIEKQKNRAAHYPWWKLGELAKNNMKFDIVASNANLLEFSRPALLDYLPMIQSKLNKNGVFVFHCEGGHFNGSLDTLFEDLYNFDFAPLFFRAGEMMAVGHSDSLSGRIAIAPAGNNATRLLLKNEQFTSQFEEIVLVDDSKAGTQMFGFTILTRDEFLKTGISQAIVYHEKNQVADIFYEFFKSHNIEVLNIKASRLGRSFGVFVGKEHTLFEKYHKKEHFVFDFNSHEECVENLFEFGCDKKKFYTKDKLADMLTTRFSNNI